MNTIEALSTEARLAMNGSVMRDREPAPVHPDRPASEPSFSSLGKALSKTVEKSGEFQDIDDSGLPDAVKNILKIIRKLRQELAELSRMMQKVQADSHLDLEAKRVQFAQLQAQISEVNGALATASQMLADLLQNLKLGSTQAMQVVSLSSH